MTYGNVTTNINPCIGTEDPKVIAVIDTRTLDNRGFKTDGEIKYLIPSFGDGYEGKINDCLVLWGGNANCAWETISRLGEESAHLQCESIEEYAERIKRLSDQILGGRGEDDGWPSFALIGYEGGDAPDLVMKVVYEGRVQTPRPGFFEIGSPLLIDSGYSTADVEPDELVKANTGKLTYNGINHFTDKTNNVIVGGTPAVIAFYDGKMRVVDGSYCSFIGNVVTAREEEWPDYRRGDSYLDIETILKRSDEFGEPRHLEDSDLCRKIQEDREALRGIASTFNYDVVDMMSGRIGRRIWRDRKRMVEAEKRSKA